MRKTLFATATIIALSAGGAFAMTAEEAAGYLSGFGITQDSITEIHTNAFGRTTVEATVDGVSYEIKLDSSGNVIKAESTDPNGNETKYDSNGQPIAEDDGEDDNSDGDGSDDDSEDDDSEDDSGDDDSSDDGDSGSDD